MIVDRQLAFSIRFAANKAAADERALHDADWLERRLTRWYKRLPLDTEAGPPTKAEVERLAELFALGLLA